MFGQSGIKVLNDFQALICFLPKPTRLATQIAGECQRSQCDCRWRVLDELAVEKRDFHQKPCNMLNFGLLHI